MHVRTLNYCGQSVCNDFFFLQFEAIKLEYFKDFDVKYYTEPKIVLRYLNLQNVSFFLLSNSNFIKTLCRKPQRIWLMPFEAKNGFSYV